MADGYPSSSAVVCYELMSLVAYQNQELTFSPQQRRFIETLINMYTQDVSPSHDVEEKAGHAAECIIFDAMSGGIEIKDGRPLRQLVVLRYRLAAVMKKMALEEANQREGDSPDVINGERAHVLR